VEKTTGTCGEKARMVVIGDLGKSNGGERGGWEGNARNFQIATEQKQTQSHFEKEKKTRRSQVSNGGKLIGSGPERLRPCSKKKTRTF